MIKYYKNARASTLEFAEIVDGKKITKIVRAGEEFVSKQDLAHVRGLIDITSKAEKLAEDVAMLEAGKKEAKQRTSKAEKLAEDVAITNASEAQ